MNGKFTVVRVLAYEYDNAELMVHDMGRWTPEFVGRDMRMRSMHLPVRFEEEIPVVHMATPEVDG